MKRNLYITAIALLVLLAAGLSLRLFLRCPTEQELIEDGKLFYYSGDVLIKEKGGQDWESVRLDMEIEDGDSLITSGDSGLEIKFGEGTGNIIACNENTNIRIKKIIKSGDKDVYLDKGEVLSRVEELDEDSHFEIVTPTAVCGVVGTGFKVESEVAGTTVTAYEGSVYVKGRGLRGMLCKEKTVPAGSMLAVNKSGVPGKVEPITDEQVLKEWAEWEENLDAHMFRPLYVFYDESDDKSRYYPSGWIGDYDAIRRVSWKENPHSGKDCMRFKYTGRTPQGAGWAGVYWQNPVNNWGDVEGGYNLKGAKELTFWARGEKGGEQITRFGIGGVGGIYPDSAKAEIGPVVLEKEWKRYSIDLSGKDLSNIGGGFYWMTDKVSNPDGAIFYIDEIKYE